MRELGQIFLLSFFHTRRTGIYPRFTYSIPSPSISRLSTGMLDATSVLLLLRVGRGREAEHHEHGVDELELRGAAGRAGAVEL